MTKRITVPKSPRLNGSHVREHCDLPRTINPTTLAPRWSSLVARAHSTASMVPT